MAAQNKMQRPTASILVIWSVLALYFAKVSIHMPTARRRYNKPLDVLAHISRTVCPRNKIPSLSDSLLLPWFYGLGHAHSRLPFFSGILKKAKLKAKSTPPSPFIQFIPNMHHLWTKIMKIIQKNFSKDINYKLKF